MAGLNNEYLNEHKQFRVNNKKMYMIFAVAAVLVAVLVFWWLKLVGITITGDAFCGLEEHTHNEACYISELVCGLDEVQSTENTEASTLEASAEIHTHTEECYVQKFICTLAEHTHSADCFPDTSADTETVSVWLNTFKHVEITNNTAENLAAIAATQLGYKESTRNFEFDDAGNRNGYTRYGEWYGNPYAEWNTLFVSFCLNYANVNNCDSLQNANAERMRQAWMKKGVYSSTADYGVKKGDIVFFDLNADGTADRTGIVLHRGDTTMSVIEGDVNGEVDDVVYNGMQGVMGYGKTCELYAANHLTEVSTQETTQTTETTEPAGKVNNFISEETSVQEEVSEDTSSQDASAEEPSVQEESTTAASEETVSQEEITETEPAQEKTEEASTTEEETTAEDEEETAAEDEAETSTQNTEKETSAAINNAEAATAENEEPSVIEEKAEETSQEDGDSTPDVFNTEPLAVFATPKATIEYTDHLEGELVDAVFKQTDGTEISDGSTVYVGQTYIVSLEFCEINSGNPWLQFRHNDDGFLTYHIPSNLQCEPFTSWHAISATTENGTVEDVGEYFVGEDGLLRVRFFNDENGVNFVEKYSNVDFTIDFNATVASTQSGTTTEVVFNDEIRINLNVDGGAGMTVTKTHGQYDSETHTMDYTVRVEGTKGVVKDLVIDDQIWENHYTLRDTIVVTDLNGNVLDPQPVVSNHPSHDHGTSGGFRISEFPDFAAGEGFLITYKTQVYDHMLAGETVDMWNGLDSTGKDSNGNDVYVWSDDWLRVELEKMEKEGKQSVLEGDDGNPVPVIEWEIAIIKNNVNLQGTVVVDTLGEGLSYYTEKEIRVKRYDEWGNRLSDHYISWDDVTVNGNTMSFDLPDGYGFDIVYYTRYEELDEGEEKQFTNSVKATINGREETAGGSADVVGFIPRVSKSAHGTDGEYVYFNIEADVPAVIKDWGGFFLTDLAAFWGYEENDEGYLYVENVPEDLVITAVTESGQTVTFTPYKEGGPVENTYILVYPADGDQEHSFNIFFNTADPTTASSKWILAEDSVLTISYKIPFDAKTGVEWDSPLTGELTLEDVLLAGYKFANEAYLNYTEVIQSTGSATYEYSPKIIKKSVVNEDGTINYTVTFNNTVPGSGGNDGFIDGAVDELLFNDTFDEKLEYVPNSLIVTGYSPWQKDLWLAKYLYTGTVEGNTIQAEATDMVFYDYNEAADQYGWNGLSRTIDFRNYYHWVNAGGRFEFTYQLRVKDEYLYTTEHSHFVLDNTAELTWDDDGSSGPVTESSEYETGLIDKHVVQKDSKLDFDIHINRRALDILEGADTLTIEDTMTENLSVYWDSIVLLYQEPDGDWIDFTSSDSIYEYTVTYDPIHNKLTFVVPDSLHIRIDYTTLITESGLVSVNNAVKIDGKAEVSDIIDAVFRVDEHSGGASGSVHNITLLKQDGVTFAPLRDAKFLLYGPMGDPDATLPSGAAESIVASNGEILHYISTYETGADGTSLIETQYLTMGGPYALVETVAPEGYNLLAEPVYFYFYETDPDGIIQHVTTIIAVENFNGGFLIPETGGTGTLPLAIIGFTFMVSPVLYSIIRRKRERRLT